MKSRYVKKINENDELISDIIYLKNLNINGYHERNSFLYVINNIFDYDLILRKSFINWWNSELRPRRERLFLRKTECLITDISKLERT